MLTGAPALCADMHEVTPAQIRAGLGDETPDCVFTSPPCKGFSGLIRGVLEAAAALGTKYLKPSSK